MRRLRRKRQRKARNASKTLTKSKLTVESLEPRLLLSVWTDYLRITEIMYDPAEASEYDPESDDLQYIELQNISDTQTLQLQGVKIKRGITYTFPYYSLGPEEFVLVAENPGALKGHYGDDLPVVNTSKWTGTLSDRSDRLELKDPSGVDILDFIYNYDEKQQVEDIWYPITNDRGFSLTIEDTSAGTGEWDNRKGWRPSSREGGTPGTDDPVERKVVINEILTHTDGVLGDWIELFNETPNPVSIGGWYLSDSASNLTKYQIPAGTEIPGNGYVVFTSTEHFGNTGDPYKDFGLSEFGESVHLTEVNDLGEIEGFFEEKIFGASEREVSFGRVEKSGGTFGFVAMKVNTPNMANSDPKVDPVVISEIMYNPASDNANHEYVKLTNITGLPALLEQEVSFRDEDLQGNIIITKTEIVPWKFTDGIDYTFPAGMMIPAYGSVIVASNPVEFTKYYGPLPSGVMLLGGFTSGKLSNQGEGLEISMPNDETPVGVETVRYIVKDRVRYDDKAPWPTAPDGGGKSLARIQNDKYGNDPINWRAAEPLNQPPTIVTFFDTPDPVTRGDDLTLTAAVSDPGDIVTRVEFYRNANTNNELDLQDTLLGVDSNGADGWSWTGSTSGFALGNNRYFVRSQDDDAVWSFVVSTVGQVNAAPIIVSLTADPDPVSQSSTLTLTAGNVADADGTVVSVEFYRDTNGNGQLDADPNEWFGTDSSGADGWSWSGTLSDYSIPLGAITYFARAQDNDGAWSDAVQATGTIIPPNVPPTIDSLSVDPNPVTLGEFITLTANTVLDSDGNVTLVTFYRDANGNDSYDQYDQLIGVDTNGADGWSFFRSTVGLPIGTNTFFARVQDNKNDWSNVVSTTGEIEFPNVSPTIDSLSDSPDPVIEGDNLTLTAITVNDTDGKITQVEFYHDTNGNNLLDVEFDDLLGTVTENSPDWSWTGSTAGFEVGEHRYFVRAQDNDGEWSNGTITTTGQVDPANESPTVSSLTDSPDPVTQGEDLTLTALGVADADGDETVIRVEFYLDDGDGVFEAGEDTPLGEDEDGANGWSWTGLTTDWAIGDYTYFARVQDDFGAWSEVVSTTGAVEEFFVDLTTYGAIKQVVYTDTNNSVITIKLKNLSAELFFDNIDVDVDENRGKVTIDGATELNRIEIVDPARGASLTFTVKGGTGMAELGGITGDYLDKLTGKTITLVGDIDLTGYLGAVTLDDIAGNANITTQQASAKGFSLKADVVNAGATFDLADQVKKFQVNSFTGGLLQANSIGKVVIKKGIFGAHVKALNGDILSISAVDDITGHLIADNIIKKVVTKAGDFTGVARAGNLIGLIQALNLDGAIISAGNTVQKVNIKNDITKSYILGGYDISSDGLFGAGDILGSGSVLSVTAKGTFDQSYVAAGFLPSTPDTDFLLDVGVPKDFGEIGKVSFGVVDPLTSPNEFGLFAATNIKSVKVKNGPSETESQFIVDDMNG